MVATRIQFTFFDDIFYTSEKFQKSKNERISVKKRKTMCVQSVTVESKTSKELQNYKKELWGNKEVQDPLGINRDDQKIEWDGLQRVV